MTTLYRCALAITFICSTTSYAASEPKTELFEGLIGAAPVMVEFSIDQNQAVTGRQFYRKFSKDIVLNDTQLKNGDIQLGENRDYDDDSTIDMILHPHQQDWQGTWTGRDPKKHKNIAIQLKLRLSKQKK